MASPLLGYNTNVRHDGKLYHIQTEDSGIDRPHILTHLFADGGRVVASKKCVYAEYVGRDDYADHVKQMMREQHKAMFIELRDGVFDEPGTDTPAVAPRPSNVDVDALERAAQRLSHPSEAGIPAVSELEVGSIPHAGVPDDAIPDTALPEAALTHDATLPGSQSAPAPFSRRPPSETMRRPSRPAHAEEQVRAGASIFGDDLLSEKSLDEVILSYLAEDLEDA
ncbi:MAG: hypothetical protein GXP55_11560 [Deltaproteobacteria bacterium]|nr:hypothetical protein [Deltaproteobacteria bacterium]